MSKKRFIIGFIFVLVLVNFVGVVSADGSNLISPEGVKYDSRIEGKFFYHDRVYIRVHLRDESGVVFNGSMEENRAMLKIHDVWFQERINETLKNYSTDDFVFHTFLPKGFGMFVTKEGFERFLEDERISSVSLEGYGTVAGFMSLRYIRSTKILIGILIILIILYAIKKKRNKNGPNKK